MKNEIWKEIRQTNGDYQVSSLGRIKSLKWRKERIIKQSIIKATKYPVACIYGKKASLIHRIVALEFVPNPNNKPQVNHKNGIKTDNRIENLEWVTSGENQSHAIKTGLKIPVKGEQNGSAKLTNRQIKRIRLSSETQSETATKYKVCQSNISRIKNNQTWKH